jgi:putative ABC transport system permease protein
MPRLTDHGDPLRIRQALITSVFFPTFGAHAARGRLLQPSDSQDPNAAVVSYATWLRVFGGDPAIIGRSIDVDDAPVRIVGVLDPSFVPPEAIVGSSVDLWRPLDPGAEYSTSRDDWMFRVAGHLRSTATLAQAQSEATGIANQRALTWPEHYHENGRVIGLNLSTLRDATTGAVARPLRLLLGAALLLLLVACANVTHLFLARGVGRVREMALRRALGARTRALVAQLLIESGMLGAAGAMVGALAAWVGVQAFVALMPGDLPRGATIAVDARVLLFAAAVGMITAMVFGLIPALQLARTGSGDLLRGSGRTLTGSRGALRLRSGLIVAEVALSLVLVAQSGWLLRSFVRMSHADLGFRTSGVVEIPLSIPAPAATSADSIRSPGTAWFARMDRIRESVASTRGVQRATFGLTMPLQWVGGARCCWATKPKFEGQTALPRSSATHLVSDDFFDTFGIRFAAGAAWTRGAATGAPYPAVLSEQLARQAFGTATAALGRTFVIGPTAYRVVGVLRDTRHYGVDQPYEPALYIPASTLTFAPDGVTLAVRTDRSDNSLAADLRAAVWRVEPRVPVPSVNTVAELAREDGGSRRFDTVLFGAFSAVALLLVAAGLAGTLLYMVSLQRRSLGIRLALGATPGALERRVLGNGIGLTALGAVIGTVGAWFAGRLIESRLYGVNARDVGTLGAAVGVMMAIALVASWIPARRAASTSPIESLRGE